MQISIHAITHLVKGTALEQGVAQILAMMIFPEQTAKETFGKTLLILSAALLIFVATRSSPFSTPLINQ
jgi:hypothetical protein